MISESKKKITEILLHCSARSSKWVNFLFSYARKETSGPREAVLLIYKERKNGRFRVREMLSIRVSFFRSTRSFRPKSAYARSPYCFADIWTVHDMFAFSKPRKCKYCDRNPCCNYDKCAFKHFGLSWTAYISPRVGYEMVQSQRGRQRWVGYNGSYPTSASEVLS